MQQNLDPQPVVEFVDASWNGHVLSSLSDFIRVPNQSPAYDPDWSVNGRTEEAIQVVSKWSRSLGLLGMRQEVLTAKGIAPALLIEVAGAGPGVFCYGHLDKQPPSEGWKSGFGACIPRVEEGKLFGRGSVDDGYAVYAILTAVQVLQSLGVSHPSFTLLMECAEESGSPGLESHLERVTARIDRPQAVFCIDSLCGDYRRLWCTTSLRGGVDALLKVRLLRDGVHSGLGGGLVADSFRVIRHLLDRLEDTSSGCILPDEMQAEIPSDRRRQASEIARILGPQLLGGMPLIDGARPVGRGLAELVLNSTWRPSLTVTGQRGLPPAGLGGNVIQPAVALNLSLRLPPTCDPALAARRLKGLLEGRPPYGAKVELQINGLAAGWNAPALDPELAESLDRASRCFFSEPVAFIGVGGGIPVVSMLSRRFPDSALLVTGVLGPDSNPHGPNESLDLTAARRLTCCLAQVFSDLASS